MQAVPGAMAGMALAAAVAAALGIASPAVASPAVASGSIASAPLAPTPLVASPRAVASPPAYRLGARGRAIGVTAAYGGSSRLAAYEHRARLAAPVLIRGRTAIAVLAGYDRLHLDSRRTVVSDSDARRFDLGVGGSTPVDDRRAFIGSLSLTHSSDLTTADSLAWQVTASAALRWDTSASQGLMAGVAYSSTFDYRVLPLVGWVYEPKDSRVRFEVLVPQHVRVEVSPSPRVRVGLGFELAGRAWAATTRPGTVELARRTSGTFVIDGSRAIAGPIRVQARAGIGGELSELPGADGLVELPLRASAFAQVGLVIVP